MARYGSVDDETVITEYLDTHLEGGIKQKNLDLVLNLIDEFVELKESVMEGGRNMEDKIKEAIDLLRKNDYVVVKIKDRMNEDADKCAETGYGDCTSCSCFICAAGLE